jgi:hypothetical protein
MTDLERALAGDKNLAGTDLRDADLRDADLRDADLRDADLRDADLRSAFLENCDLRGANLRGASLGGADIGGARLEGTNLSGAHFDYYDLVAEDLAGVTYDATTVWPEDWPRGLTPPRQNRPARYRDNSTASDVNKFFGALASGVSDGAIKKGLEYFVRGQREDGEAFLRPYMSEVPASRRKEIFDAADKLRVKPGEDYRSAAVQKYLTDVLVPWFRKTLAATR